MEASEIFLRLLNGETIRSDDIRETVHLEIISAQMKIGWLFKKQQVVRMLRFH